MNKIILLFVLALSVWTGACNRKENVRPVSPLFKWSFDGIDYTATYIQIDYNAQFGGYYEPVVVYEDATALHTLTLGLTNGQAIGSHTVSAYWVNYVIEEKGNPNLINIVFQNYSVEVTDYNGNFVSGYFSANNATGPALSGTFTDINSVP